MLNKIEQQKGTEAQQQVDFDAYLSNQSHTPATAEEREALFRDFLKWRAAQQTQPGQKK